jgi:MFS family permease
MVVLGVIIFAGASALCGATPRGSAAEAWLVAFRALQGLGGAIMFPAAIAIVVVTFDLRTPTCTRPRARPPAGGSGLGWRVVATVRAGREPCWPR